MRCGAVATPGGVHRQQPSASRVSRVSLQLLLLLLLIAVLMRVMQP